ncbi:MAG: dephospho-CoA kinase [Planctomycetota bacterium]|jgi:dephospho-CoA kinase
MTDDSFSSPPRQASRASGESRPVVFGVLGGIAAGKSHVSRLLAGQDGVILSADEAAHEALRSPEIVENLVEAFGPEILGEDGAPDRAALARIVFEDPKARKRLEEWIHPVVRATLHAALENAAAQGVSRVVLDVPLLLENAAEHGLLALCDHLVFIDTPDADRDARAVVTRGWATGEVARREAAQIPLSEKRRAADIVIDNRGDVESLTQLVQAELLRLNLS